MSERFYINCPLTPGPVELDGAEAHHIAGVRRFRAGDAIVLFNGDGAEYPATVSQVSKKTVVLDVQERREASVEVGRPVEVAAPLPRGDRTSFLIEKLTELGVTTFVPLRCERSVIDPGEGKLEKLERAVIEASKQCGRNTLMAIEPPADWRDYVLPRGVETRYLAHTDGGDRRPLPDEVGGPVRLVVGPEGGFTPAEVTAAVENGWRLTTLGPRVLRVETAVLVLAAHFTSFGA